ncbi:MAG: hypothetical protein J6W10_06300 [Kiritimatiellae bacterium]|nr:hypothetical protein [Kiritimatiellia bacterium]
MILKTVVKSLARGKARFICAVIGVAAAVGAVTFVTSLSAANPLRRLISQKKPCVRGAHGKLTASLVSADVLALRLHLLNLA